MQGTAGIDVVFDLRSAAPLCVVNGALLGFLLQNLNSGEHFQNPGHFHNRGQFQNRGHFHIFTTEDVSEPRALSQPEALPAKAHKTRGPSWRQQVVIITVNKIKIRHLITICWAVGHKSCCIAQEKRPDLIYEITESTCVKPFLLKSRS